LYLPKEWAEDSERREKTEVPKEVEFQDQAGDYVWVRSERQSQQIWTVALFWLTRLTASTPEFRDGVTELDLQYVVGVQSSMDVWEPGKQPLPAKPRGKMGRPPRLLQRPRTINPSP